MQNNPRGPGRLATITYQQIAEWAGLSLNTVRAYAQQGQFDPHNIGSTITWINSRRARQGKPLIGAIREETEVEDEPAALAARLQQQQQHSGYNPLTAEFDQ